MAGNTEMNLAMVNVVRWLMIAVGLSLLPLYGLWVYIGYRFDARDRRRNAAFVAHQR
jgi:hypothetical protein